MVKVVKWNGFGSQTETSQTSLSGSGYARDEAVAAEMALLTYRKGEDDAGELSTRTRCAEGVFGGRSTGCSNNR